VYVNLALGGTIPAVYGVCVASPSTSATATNTYGVYVGGQGSANTANAYGIYIAAQSGSSGVNIGLYNAGTSKFIGAASFGSDPTPPLIHGMAAPRPQSLVIESPNDFVDVAGKAAVALSGNSYFDGTNWQRYDVAQAAVQVSASSSGFIVYGAAAGANPISAWTTLLNLPAGGPLTVSAPGLTVNGGTVNFAGAIVNPNLAVYTIPVATAIALTGGAWTDLPNSFTPTTSGNYAVVIDGYVGVGVTATIAQLGLSSVPTGNGTTLIMGGVNSISIAANTTGYLNSSAVVNLIGGTTYKLQMYSAAAGCTGAGRMSLCIRVN
jgi:hypothetical protein